VSEKIAKQYDNIALEFARSHDIGENSNRFNREVFYKYIDFLKPGMKLGCRSHIDV
jgi:hypothetical protein